MAVKPLKSGKVKLKDRFGGAFRGFFSGRNEFYPGGQTDQRRFIHGKLDRDILTLMSEQKQRMLIGDGRYIHQSDPVVSGCCAQKADYVYGNSWRLQSHSADADFRNAVEADFKKIDRMLDIRGSGFSFRQNVWLLSKSIDVDGDVLIVLTESANGFPQLQYFEAHKLGSWENDNEPTVQAGRYRGRRIVNGVIYDEHLAPMAYRILDEGSDAGYRDFPASAVIHVVDYKWFSQARGTPSICAGILDWYDLAETKDAQKIKTKVNSALTLIESNETGVVDTGRETVSPKPRRGDSFQTQLFDAGMVRLIKNGGSLTAHTANDPSQGWLDFTKMVQQSAIFGMRWRREMFDGEQLARAGARGVVNDVNAAVRARCEVIDAAMKRAALYIIAKRAKMGTYTLPADWFEISFTKPAEFTVDEGRMRAADIDDLRAGLNNERSIVERRGQDYVQMLNQRADDIALKKQIAAAKGLQPDELGTLSLPGDPAPLDTANPE